MTLSRPTIIAGRYQIREPVGEGSFSITYRATDTVLGRDVAVKVLRDQYVSHAGFASRFENEARAAALISHPNVIQVFDYGRQDETVYIVMQFVHGPSLKDYIREEGPLTVEEAVEFIRQILEGLAAIHEAGIVHRDVKPQNALLEGGHLVKLTDFGIARLDTGTSGLTEAGTALGTASYMAPEQASGQMVGPEADLYSVGVILYEMLTGRLPFPGDNPVQVMYRHVNELPPPPRVLNRQIPVTIEAITLKTLSKEPQDRYPSARAMRDALMSPGIESTAMRRREPVVDPTQATAVAPVIAGAPPRIPPPPPRAAAGRRRGNPWFIGIPLVVALAIVLFMAALVMAGGDDDDANTTPVASLATATSEPTATSQPSPTETQPAAVLTLEPTASPTATLTPTIAPTATVTPSPTVAPTATATTEPPTPTPTEEPAPAPTVAFNQPIALPDVPQDILAGPSVTLEAGDFEGAYRREDGILYGLPATHLYGEDSDAEAATASFDVDEEPDSYILITITGMDDELDEKVPMQLWLNDNLVWEGPSPFANEDWTDVAWLVGSLDWIEEGENELTVVNAGGEGEIGTPPWILLTSSVVYVD